MIPRMPQPETCPSQTNSPIGTNSGARHFLPSNSTHSAKANSAAAWASPKLRKPSSAEGDQTKAKASRLAMPIRRRTAHSAARIEPAVSGGMIPAMIRPAVSRLNSQDSGTIRMSAPRLPIQRHSKP